MMLPDPAIDRDYYADLMPKRFFAWLIDIAIIFLLVTVVLLFTLFMTIFVLPIVWFMVAMAYRSYFLIRFDGTPGMRLLALRLRKLDGTRPEPSRCVLHSLIHAACMTSLIGQIASVAMMVFTPYRQGIHDMLLGTTMVHYDPRADRL